MIRPDLVLFNGGFFTPPVARDRVAQALAAWFGDAPAVAGDRQPRGGGRRRRGDLCPAAGRRRPRSVPLVKAGSGRAYYIALVRRAERTRSRPSASSRAAPRKGRNRRFDHPFTVATNRPVSFSLYSSTTRSDRAGDIVSLDPDVTTRGNTRRSSPCSATDGSRATSSCRSDCRSRSPKSARSSSGAESQASDHRWRLQFQVRSAAEEMDGRGGRGAGG